MRILLENLRKMAKIPFFILKSGIIVSISLLIGALVLIFGFSGFDTYNLLEAAESMRGSTLAVLFVAVLLSAVAQDFAG